jgi:hypothetical protein
MSGKMKQILIKTLKVTVFMLVGLTSAVLTIALITFIVFSVLGAVWPTP